MVSNGCAETGNRLWQIMRSARGFMKLTISQIIIVLALFAFPQFLLADDAIDRTRKIVDEIVASSYPELKNVLIEIKTFQSESDYFRSSFSMSRYVSFRKMRCVIYVNPEVYQRNAPEIGIRSIIAHELAHAIYFTEHNRLKMLGLAGLLTPGYTSRFEHRADLEAISRNYGAGLRDYREWLYKNVPANKLVEKKRNYYSPGEVDIIIEILKRDPDKIKVWLKNVPLNADDLLR